MFVFVRYRVDEACPPSPCASVPGGGGGGGGGRGAEQQLQVKIQAFEEKMGEARAEEEVEEDSPASLRRYSLSQAVREERREMRFNRSVGLCHLHGPAENCLKETYLAFSVFLFL